MYFSLERQHYAMFHPFGIFRHHWSLLFTFLFTYLFTFLFTWKVVGDLRFWLFFIKNNCRIHLWEEWKVRWLSDITANPNSWCPRSRATGWAGFKRGRSRPLSKNHRKCCSPTKAKPETSPRVTRPWLNPSEKLYQRPRELMSSPG